MAAPFECRGVFRIKGQLILPVQRLQDSSPGDEKVNRWCKTDLFCGVLLYRASNLDHVLDRLHRRVEREIFRLLHLPRVDVDIAEAAFFVRSPVLAIAKGRDEIAERD